MLISSQLPHVESTDRTKLPARGYASHIALTGLLSGSLLLMPGLGTAAEDATPALAAVAPDSSVSMPTAGSPRAPVSPYAKANRQRAQAAAATGARSTKGALVTSPSKATRSQRP
jgi:hypothetical protein